MHIKQVVINGFKSYSQQAVDNLSDKVNCLVGLNGSGKSNFLQAICFVISDLFHNLRSEAKRELLQEGVGHEEPSAYVEIVFDNLDNRIPVDKEEVSLRRTISAKKSEYFLNGKKIPKKGVIDLLESSGFFCSNPYYIVQSGEIPLVALMKDSERLDLLKEIGVTRVFEESTSLKIVQKTGKKKKQTIQDIQYLDGSFHGKEELEKYERLDKQRKYLEYAIYDKELDDAKQKLVEIEEDRKRISENSGEVYDSILAEAQEKSKRKRGNESVDDLFLLSKGSSENRDQKKRKWEDIKVGKDHLKVLEDKYQPTLQDKAKELKQLLSKKNAYLAKQKEYSKKITELGPLSSDAFETYKQKGIKELYELLHKCNERLQQLSHVNKKDLDQYLKFKKLQRKQDELDQRIAELTSFLDMEKDKLLESTLNGVAEHFREEFSELVKGGHGFLVMMKKKDNTDLDNDQNAGEPRPADAGGNAEKYTGVKVKVSFPGHGETQLMEQLTMSQKTIVALALSFAIHRCNPAPFFLFDHIDAELDCGYRTAVGNAIRRHADMSSTQFITTTFWPELVNVADEIYEVTQRHGVSQISVVSKDDALDFVGGSRSVYTRSTKQNSSLVGNVNNDV